MEKKKLFVKICLGLVILVAVAFGTYGEIIQYQNAKMGALSAQYINAMISLKVFPTPQEVSEALVKNNTAEITAEKSK